MRLIVELLAVLATPAVLLICALTGVEQTALLSLAVVVASLCAFFAGYERSRLRLRDIMPTVVLAALAAAGRILFAPVPDFKPVSAIAVIAGIVFGRKSGFMVGALAALASNFFFGQGPWTPWQMYAWGMVGYGAGVLAKLSAFSKPAGGMAFGDSSRGEKLVDQHPGLVYAYGFASCLAYGFIMNAWSILSFFHAQAAGVSGVLAVYAAALPFDLLHGAATVAFLLVLYAPWRRKLARVRRKFGLGCPTALCL